MSSFEDKVDTEVMHINEDAYFMPIRDDRNPGSPSKYVVGNSDGNVKGIHRLSAIRSSPCIHVCYSDPSLNIIHEDDASHLSVSSFRSPQSRRRAHSRPASPALSPRTLVSSRSLSPAALSRLMRTPSPQRLAQDGIQPMRGSLHDVHSSSQERDEEMDTVSWSLRQRSMSPLKSSERRARQLKVRNRPPTPPPTG